MQRGELRERNAAVPRRVGNCFDGERTEREIKTRRECSASWSRKKSTSPESSYREIVTEKEKTRKGDCTRTLFLKTIVRGKGEGFNTASFL